MAVKTVRLVWDSVGDLYYRGKEATGNLIAMGGGAGHTHANMTVLNAIQEALTTVLKGNYDTAYSHSQVAHAPSNAQKNSNILKTEIEAVLTGELSSHSHAATGLTRAQALGMISRGPF